MPKQTMLHSEVRVDMSVITVLFSFENITQIQYLSTDDLLANIKMQVTLEACYLVKHTYIGGKHNVSISTLICVTGIYLEFLKIVYESFYFHWGRNFAFISFKKKRETTTLETSKEKKWDFLRAFVGN